MKNIAKMSAEDRSDLVRVIARERNMPEAVIEKDFWVCYTLNHLFHACSFQNSIIFKGGTSLSKAYNLIDRFSEDIDIILDWRLIGYDINEPWQVRSNTKQNEFALETTKRTDSFLAEKFVPALIKSIGKELGHSVKIYLADEAETVIFEYPRSFSSNATLDTIRLEIGPLAAWSPSEVTTIQSYLAQARPKLFNESSTQIITAKPERTFWEKATILHQEAMRPEAKKMPKRYSRHYYDMYRLGHSYVKDAAFASLDLLANVVDFKDKFYRTPWASIQLAKPGTFKLVPPHYRITELSKDYDAMEAMLTGERPTFEDIINYMGELETEINELIGNKDRFSLFIER